MAHAMAFSLYKMRRDIGRIPFGVFKHNKQIGVTSLCDVEGGKDLVPVTIFDGHTIPILEYAGMLASKTMRAKGNKDKEHHKSTATVSWMPSFLAQPALFIATYLGTLLGFENKAIGLKNDQFGHSILTNVGPLGYKMAFAPLCPIAHTMSLICTGKIEKKPIVNDAGEIEIASMMTAVATGDHRYGDAAIFINFFKCFQSYIEDPDNFDHTKLPETIHYKEKDELEKAKKEEATIKQVKEAEGSEAAHKTMDAEAEKAKKALEAARAAKAAKAAKAKVAEAAKQADEAIAAEVALRAKAAEEAKAAEAAQKAKAAKEAEEAKAKLSEEAAKTA